MSKFMKIIAQEGLTMWAIHRLVKDQKAVDRFFDFIRHQDEFIKFAQFIFDNIDRKYKRYIFKECVEPVFSDKYVPIVAMGRVGDFYVSVVGPFKEGKDAKANGDPKKIFGGGQIIFYDRKKRKKKDPIRNRLIHWYVDMEGFHTYEENKMDDLKWLLDPKVELPYTQKFETP